MSLFKNIVSTAVNQGMSKVSEGVGKGIQSAVGKAVESAVKPAADKLADAAAAHVNQQAENLNQSTQELKSALNEANAAASQIPQEAAQTAAPATGGTAPAGGGLAGLGAALSGWASSMENFAADAAQNYKECPNCGEVVPKDQKFCPKCGTKLPDEAIGAGYVCPKCGKKNLPDTVYCTECGTLLPAAKAKQEKEEAKWDTLLADYPKWTQGGKIELEESGEINGYPAVNLWVDGGTRIMLDNYVESLKGAGFVPFYDGDSSIWYKVVNGVCRSFDKEDWDRAGGVSVTFFVGDYAKRKEEQEKAAAAKAAAKSSTKDAADLAKDAAKGLFKKFF